MRTGATQSTSTRWRRERSTFHTRDPRFPCAQDRQSRAACPGTSRGGDHAARRAASRRTRRRPCPRAAESRRAARRVRARGRGGRARAGRGVSPRGDRGRDSEGRRGLLRRGPHPWSHQALRTAGRSRRRGLRVVSEHDTRRPGLGRAGYGRWIPESARDPRGAPRDQRSGAAAGAREPDARARLREKL
jgi:hypothetical protein